MKTRKIFLILFFLAACLGAGACAHTDGVKGSVVSYGIYKIQIQLKYLDPKKGEDKSNIKMQMTLISELKNQSNTISISSIKKDQFGVEFKLAGCKEKTIPIDFSVSQAGKTITSKTLYPTCGKKRLLLWHDWKKLQAQGLLNKPITFSARGIQGFTSDGFSSL